MIKRLTAIALLCLSALPAMAYVAPSNPPGWDKLTDVQKAEINKQVALAAESAESPTLDVKKVDEYVVLGERIGKMMGGAAKEVGVAVNTFVETPVGKWTMVMVIWKFMGNALMHIFGGVVILIAGFTFLAVMLRRYPLEIQYRPELFLGVFNRRLTEKRRVLEDGDVWFFCISGAIVVGASLVTIFTGS